MGILTNTVIARSVAKQYKNVEADLNEDLFVTVAAGLCAPFVMEPKHVSHHRYLRRSLLSTNILMLVGLIFLRYFPLVIPSDNLADILPHVDMTNSTLVDSQDFNLSNLTVVEGVEKMALSHETFSTIIFAPLFFLTLFVTIESVLLQFEKEDGKTRFPTPYRWFDIHDYTSQAPLPDVDYGLYGYTNY